MQGLCVRIGGMLIAGTGQVLGDGQSCGMVAVARQLGKILPADLMSRVCVTQRGNVEKLKKHGLLKRQCTTWKLHRKRSHPELVHKDSFQGACVCVCGTNSVLLWRS